MLSADDTAILARAAGQAYDPDVLNADEHARYHAYVAALCAACASIEGSEEAVLGIVVSDDDEVMAQSAVVRYIDRKATLPHEDAERLSVWRRRIEHFLSDFEFARDRMAEWETFKRLDQGAQGEPEVLRHASDWLQRHVAETSVSEPAVAWLAKHGRTERIRRMASERLARDSL